MGNSESTRPLEQWNKDDVANSVASLGGPKYKEYASSIRDSGIDGGLLTSLEDKSELQDMMDELEISSKIHRRVIARALESSLEDHQEKEDKTTAAIIAVETTSKQVVPDFLAAEEYGLTAFTPVSEMHELDGLSQQLLRSNSNTSYAGVHLCRTDGMHVLCGNLRGPNGQVTPMDRGKIMDHGQSFCSQLVLDKSKDFVIREATLEAYRSIGSTYVGHVLKNEHGARLGVVCQFTTDSFHESQRDAESLRLVSAEIAAMMEQQLRLRKQLLDRNKSLSEQVETSKKEYMDMVRNQEQVQRQEDIAKSESRSVEDPCTNSNLLPFVAKSYLASELEREHIPASVDKEAFLLGMPKPPIGKDDMARVARVEALGLHNIDPNSPMAKQLKGLIARTCSLFGFPIVTITIHNHMHQFCLGMIDSGLGIIDVMDVVNRDVEGTPFCLSYTRGVSACNYTILKRRTFMVPDMSKDETFKNYGATTNSPLRAYVGTPIISSDGYVVAVLCMLDSVPRYDFTKSHELEIERMALLVTQSIENWEHRRLMDQLLEERKLLEQLKSSMAMQASKKREAPSGEVTIVLTDIQGSTASWEADAEAMKEALILHDQIIRKCVSHHSGYEIKTEGDAFHLAFHDPLDAIGFALQAQIDLYKANWSDNILALPDAGVDGDGCFRGLRVRMGIHHGSATPQINEVSGRALYSGKTFRVAKSVEALCFGGQILATAETWRVVSELSEQLGTPQVVDYGEYILMTGEFIDEGIIAKGVVQLVPNELAYDYFSLTGSTGSSQEVLGSRGRRFPQVKSTRRLTSSFLDAPNNNGAVTMLFVYPSGTDDIPDDLADRTFSILTKVVRSLLSEVSPPGYECQEDKGKWVIAFHSMIPAVKFGVMLMKALGNAPLDKNVDASSLIRVGIHSGAFSGMGPHNKTGRADYVGPVVNRAARVAAATDPGKVFVGMPVVDPAAVPPPPDIGSTISVDLVCITELKGVSCKIALFHCRDRAEKGRIVTILRDKRIRHARNGNDAESKPSRPKTSLLESLRVRRGRKT